METTHADIAPETEPGAVTLNLNEGRIDGDLTPDVGPIDVAGDLVISGSVAADVSIRALGDLVIDGPVGDATLLVGGSLSLPGGMTSVTRGQVLVDGDVHASGLEGIRGRVRGGLSVSGRITDCELVVGGFLVGDALVGGVTHVTGAVELQVLGSDGDHVTQLDVAATPILAHRLRRLDTLIATRETQLMDASTEAERTDANYAVAAARTRRTELMADISERRRLDVIVHEIIESGVHFVVAGQTWAMLAPLPGPVHLTMDDDNIPMIAIGDADPLPLDTVADRADQTL